MGLVDSRDRELLGDVAMGITHRLLVGRVERGFVLVDQDAIVAQRLEAGAVELAGEETLGGAVGIRRVDDDEVVLGLLAPPRVSSPASSTAPASRRCATMAS